MGERGKDCLPLKIKQKSSETLAAHRSDFRCRNVLLAVLSEGGFLYLLHHNFRFSISVSNC